MLRTLGLVCFLLISPVSITLANDDLVREMQLEVQIQEMGKEALKVARGEAFKAYRQTTHSAKLEKARAEHLQLIAPSTEYKAAQRRVLEAEARVGPKKFIYDVAQRSIDRIPRWRINSAPARKLYALYQEHSRALQDALTELEDAERTFQPFKRRHEESKAAAKAIVDALMQEKRNLVNRFARKIYEREMRRKLRELKIEITKDIQEKVQRSYKKWEA